MTKEQAAQLAPGLYRLHWKSGGSSLAAVGNTHNGTRWFAPVNWSTEVAGDVVSTEWRPVEYVDAIEIEPDLDARVAALEARVTHLEGLPVALRLRELDARVHQLETHPAGCSCTRCTG